MESILILLFSGALFYLTWTKVAFTKNMRMITKWRKRYKGLHDRYEFFVQEEVTTESHDRLMAFYKETQDLYNEMKVEVEPLEDASLFLHVRQNLLCLYEDINALSDAWGDHMEKQKEIYSSLVRT